VIDNTSHFRMDPDVPLIIPEVNPEALEGYRNKNIIANPNCSTIQMLVPLKPLHDLAIIKRIVVSTYQSVSGAGKSAMDELWDQTRKMFFNETETQESKNFNKRIAFNVIPQIDKFLDDGSTKEEVKMVNETKKILDSTIEVSATCVRVPVFIGHAESVNIEFENNISIEEIRDILGDTDGVSLVDNIETETYITPIECVSDFSVFVSRLRLDHTVPSGINMWVVSDNLRKGAALNSVQIAEELINRKYI
jgi:aspartate-semialdehyde dehydrogenase